MTNYRRLYARSSQKNDSLLRQAMEIFQGSMEGDPASFLWRLTGYGPRLGGKEPLAGMFRPVSADEQVAAEFRREHEPGMRAEVLRSVQHALRVWDNTTGLLQEDVDALFVALAQLARFLRAHAPDPVVQRVLDECLAAQDDMASAWLQRVRAMAE